MKTKLTYLFASELVLLSPILLGLYFYADLPERVAVHFDLSGQADNFVGKALFIFFIPILFAALQLLFFFASQQSKNRNFRRVMLWLLPVLSLLLQIALMVYNLGVKLDMRVLATFIVAIIFLILGNFMPKLSAMEPNVKNLNTRKMGHAYVLAGILFLLSLLLPAIVTIVLIPIFALVNLYLIVIEPRR